MSESTTVQKTHLNGQHRELKAKMMPFGGWDMPISYEGVIAEHKTVREACGIFDVSHMGEIRIKGPQANEFTQYITINDIGRLNPGQGQYSAILNDKGGMIDDLIIYRLGADELFACVNASNIEKDFAWIKEQSARFNVTVTNESNLWSQIAVQGPTSQTVLGKVLGPEANKLEKLAYMEIIDVTVGSQKALVARTGYTGEHGYEIYMPHALVQNLWTSLLAQGAKPIGLGARDTLRLEACYLLYGNDMNETVSPLEAGIAWAVRIEDKDFIGKKALEAQKTGGLKRKMVAFLMDDKAIARHDMKIFVGEREAGVVTSGSFLPTLDAAGGMALVDSSIKLGDTIEIDVRGKRKLAKVVKRPLYSAKVK